MLDSRKKERNKHSVKTLTGPGKFRSKRNEQERKKFRNSHNKNNQREGTSDKVSF
jgi:hypothetical protein